MNDMPGMDGTGPTGCGPIGWRHGRCYPAMNPSDELVLPTMDQPVENNQDGFRQGGSQPGSQRGSGRKRGTGMARRYCGGN
ncbi:MAG: hypothetical protein LUQ50_08035 [Methanospirillum sp.]|uniref:hypothetical protein n=1 Tax=Methanospirillum sp. TaxID=45200 RepID=UPI002373FD0F|nr:hypothetical protein [Methanospirillum sp.]MDD1729006.1 hypothetical protein [Methanospirillum sp.]